MKKFIFIAVSFLFIISCTSEIMEMNDGGTTFTQVVETSDINKITEEQALDIANKILTRTRANTNISVSYVLNENNPITRSAGVSDTLAYIF